MPLFALFFLVFSDFPPFDEWQCLSHVYSKVASRLVSLDGHATLYLSFFSSIARKIKDTIGLIWHCLL